MVKLKIKNLKEIDEQFHTEITEICNEKVEYYKELFKKYGKELTLEVIFNNSSLNKVSASLNLKSKKIIVVEEDKEIIKALLKLFSELKKVIKRQYELERKDYEYKRKR